jgi:hypothetical protein
MAEQNKGQTGDDRAFMADLNDVRDDLSRMIREQVIPALQQMANSVERFTDPRSCEQHQALVHTWRDARRQFEQVMIPAEILLMTHLIITPGHTVAKPAALRRLDELDMKIVAQMVENLFPGG